MSSTLSSALTNATTWWTASTAKVSFGLCKGQCSSAQPLWYLTIASLPCPIGPGLRHETATALLWPE